MPSWWLGFDEGFDAVALEGRRLAPVRVGAIVPVAWLTCVNLGHEIAFTWGAAAVTVEVWTWLATRPHTRAATPTPGQRLNFLFASLGFSATWLTLASLNWTGPMSTGLQYAALLLWAALLLNGISFSFRSRLGLAIFAGPVALAMLIEPVLIPRFHGALQITALIGMATCIAYGFMSALQNMRAADKLATATALLEAQVHAVEAAGRAKSDFLAMMSHELRTPMNGVLGMAHALETTALESRQRDYVRTIINSGDGLMAILNDILDLSKIEAGRMEIETRAFDLHDVIVKARDLWVHVTDEKGLTLACDLDADVPRWVLGDVLRVRQILLNLMSNAVKFTDAGEVRIRLQRGEGGEGIVLSVTDTGPGIGEDIQQILFQTFAQADASIARRHGGTGLGLAICRQLARLMGGEIDLTSTLGQGSCFTVRLPLAPVEASGESRPSEAAAHAEAGLRILVVDDNATNRAVARALLESIGVEVTVAGDGVEALERLKIERFDAILMDVHMPVMNGIEAVARIRQGETMASDTPIVALTADAMAGERERLLMLGFDDYLSKPIHPAALVATLERLHGRGGPLALSA
jgi:signal transduction histidine kinase/ActR/RegA family two-component response regulator